MIVTDFDTSASSASSDWESIKWQTIEKQVFKLQMRIAKAFRAGRHNKAKSLQWLLTHSYYPKLLAVRRVTQNSGSKTAGIDKIIWKTPEQKLQAVSQLKRKGYQAQALRRIYIPKNGSKKLRPLGIPTMRDRAMQALYLLTLQPISETLADRNAYGFRPKRSCADAAEQCFKIFARKTSAQWILEGDIKSCFDEINHEWLLNNIPMDKIILSKWLKSGYMELNQFHATNLGVPQGATISANLLTITLSGLEDALKAATKPKDKVNLVTYADDLIISGATPEILKNIVQPLVANFIKERGLVLSDEKTLITHIDKGFDFLGFNIRKYKNKLLIKPAKKNVKRFLGNIREIIKAKATTKTENLIRILNPKIRGWGNYFRHVCSKTTFNKIDHHIFQAIWKWAKRRHPKKNLKWIAKKYFGRYKSNNWVFRARLKSKLHQKDQCKILRLFKASSIAIKRHIKIRAAAHPYDLEYKKYFIQRARKMVVGNYINAI